MQTEVKNMEVEPIVQQSVQARKRKSYSLKFKLEVVKEERLTAGEATARKYGIHPRRIREWEGQETNIKSVLKEGEETEEQQQQQIEEGEPSTSNDAAASNVHGKRRKGNKKKMKRLPGAGRRAGNEKFSPPSRDTICAWVMTAWDSLSADTIKESFQLCGMTQDDDQRLIALIREDQELIKLLASEREKVNKQLDGTDPFEVSEDEDEQIDELEIDEQDLEIE